jgi:hypothetical protein
VLYKNDSWSLRNNVCLNPSTAIQASTLIAILSKLSKKMAENTHHKINHSTTVEVDGAAESQDNSPLEHYLQDINRHEVISMGQKTDESQYQHQLHATTEKLTKMVTDDSESN